jgi:uncharacterized repeat protein (TIGR01451 family)
MKNITFQFLIIITLIIYFHSTSFAQWTKVPGPFGGTSFFMESYAGKYWSGSESGLYHSVDGQQWNRSENLGETRVIAGLVDQDTLYIVRGETNSELLTTIDGGQTWLATPLLSGYPGSQVRLHKSKGLLMIFGLNSDFPLTSKDNGLTIDYLLFGAQLASRFDANHNMIVSSPPASLSVSFNAGNTFSNRMYPTGFNSCNALFVLDSAIVIRLQQIAGGAVGMKISFDTAQTWNTILMPTGFSIVSPIWRSGKKTLITKIGLEYAMTTNYGNSWTVFSAPESPLNLISIDDSWLMSSEIGFYKSSNQGVTWDDSSQGFSGTNVYKVVTSGNRLFVSTVSSLNSKISIYYSEIGTTEWTKCKPNFQSTIFNVQGLDTILTYDQISLDGGQTSTFIQYSNVSSFSSGVVNIHNNQAYIPIGFKIYVVPFVETPTPQVINGQAFDISDILFVGDSLYLVDRYGSILLQLPNTTEWIPLTAPQLGYSGKLFNINGRIFQPRLTDLRISDDGSNFQILPVVGLNDSDTTITTINDMIGVGNVIVAITDKSLYFSTDKGLHWWPFQTGLPDNVLLYGRSIALNNDIIYAALIRQGLWQRKVDVGSSSGVVYRDENQNNIQEASELPMPNTKVLGVLSNNLTLTDSTGRYDLIFDLSKDTVRVLAPSIYNTIQPSFKLVNGIQQNNDFGIGFQPDITDLSINLTNTTVLRPGFENDLILHLKNVGTSVSKAVVGLRLPADVQFLSSVPQPTLVLGDSLIWNTDSISVLGNKEIMVHIQLASTTPISTILTFNSSIQPESIDFRSIDNNFVLKTTVLGSYDPNDKQVLPRGHITPVEVAAGVSLRYTIRFQNTGNYLAERVRLIDTLDTNLDLSTISVIGASHSFTWQVRDGHILEILFDHIKLLGASENETESHGFFSYTIAPKKSVTIGITLLNQAAIYFDYNSPIFTNTTISPISFESAVSNPSNNSLVLSVYPNPTTMMSIVNAPSIGGKMAIYNAKGVLLQFWPTCSEQIEINTTGLTNGVYFLRWEKDNEYVITKIVVLK